MTSSQISQLTAQSRQMGMQQMQHAAMISQQAGGMGGADTGIGEDLSGRVVNRGAAIAGPALGAGLALAGLDPFSMALKGGAAGFAGAGIAGGIAGGVAAGGAVALPLMAAKYVGGQMLTGMQQQQQLQQQLQQSFHFQNRFGGQGFTRGEAATIGQQFRGMAAQRGPGGEHTTFEELSRLAANMGRMGMAQNTRSIQEFQDNFKKMLTQVKAVAKAMSTSLEEAQEMMVGMRSSGVFRGQGRVARDIRDIAGAGGLATSEVTGAMRIGSQISRMIGGRGRAGAMGGMQAIGMVGMAQQIGSLSEEDIYNVTGQTGAQGRQAMASQMLQSSASFLKSRLGRRVVASIAGKGGTLNQEAMEEYMYGGIGTGRTMQLAYSNLAKVGRADFIRNEGRLRGQALGADPLIGIRALSGWLQHRGFDPNGDRAHIAMKRRMRGTSDEQIDAMLKMVRDLPKMQTQMAVSALRAQWSRRAQEARGRTGLRGLKRKFEAARDDVQNTLRQAGSEIYEDLTDMLDGWAADITGTVIQETAKGAADIAQDALKSGPLGEYARSRMGIGGLSATRRALGGRKRLSTLGATAGGVTRRQAMKNAGDLTRMKEAGYNINALDQPNFNWQISTAQNTARAYSMGMGGKAGAAARSFGEKYRTELSRAAGSGAITGSGWDRIQSFKEYLAGSKDPEMRKVGEQLAKMSSEEAAAYMGDIDSGTGIKASTLDYMKLPESRALLGGKAWKNDRKAAEAHANYFFGKTESNAKRRARLGIREKKSFKGFIDFLQGKNQVGARNEVVVLPGIVAVRHLSAEQVEARTRAGERWRLEAGKITRSKQFLERSRVTLGDDKRAQDELTKKLVRENMALSGGKDSSLIEDAAKQARYEVNKMHLANMDVGSAAKLAGGIENIPDETKQQLSERYHKSWEELRDDAVGTGDLVSEEERKARAQVLGEYGERFTKGAVETSRTGFLKYNKKTNKTELSAGAVKSLKASGKAGIAAAKKLAEGQETLSRLAGTGSKAEIAQYEKGQEQLADARKILEGMSVQQKRAFAKGIRGAGGEYRGMRHEALAQASIQEQLSKSRRTKGGAAAIVSQQLGLGVKGSELAGLDIKKQVNMLMHASGTTGKERLVLEEQVTKALEAAKGGKLGAAAGAIRGAQTSPTILHKAQKEQDETAARQDPSYRALSGMHKLMGQLPQAIADAIDGKKLKVDATGSFITTDDKSGGDPEGKGKGK